MEREREREVGVKREKDIYNTYKNTYKRQEKSKTFTKISLNLAR